MALKTRGEVDARYTWNFSDIFESDEAWEAAYHDAEAAIELMGRDAILNIAVYPGHEEGDAEGRMICEYLAGISRYKICATRVNILNSPTSPYFIIVETKP